ncbi:hypothetical protein GCM10011610_22500 [Nocardia rhizosphaerihabitans]|uniref:Uncharacterized protein n=1 Tax=Nocardia rhizosphaerihabitans TaxID=1691570 RepID=A0ABQ2K974_9NOCA|nr:hypothetical protein GCM10011610_22500 [Nocardia rhizosphaerihabitans]
MTEHAEHDRLGDFVASKTTLIRRHAGAFADVVADFQRAPGPATEYTLLDELDHRVEQFLAEYVPAVITSAPGCGSARSVSPPRPGRAAARSAHSTAR